MDTPARERTLRRMLDHLGPTRVGQRFGLARIASLADFRASVPILDRERHAREVESELGFGLVDARDPAVDELAGHDDERGEVLVAWRAQLGLDLPPRVAVLSSRPCGPEWSSRPCGPEWSSRPCGPEWPSRPCGPEWPSRPCGPEWCAESDDGLAERTLLADVRAFAGSMLHLAEIADPSATMAELRAFDPEVLVVPSAMVCAWLERARRMPLEHALPRLRLVLAEHDIGRPLRTRTPLASAGWFWHGLRAGVPSARMPADAIVLAVGTALFELLPYTNPEDDGRRIYAEQTVLPEHALLGHRYEVVCTSAIGLVRVRTEQHVRVVGFDPPTPLAPFPRPRVVRLSTPPADVALEGCTVAGSWLTASVRQALSREDPALVGAEIGPDLSSRPSGPELSSRPSGPELSSRPSGPELSSRPSGPELSSRPCGPELSSRPSGPELSSRPSGPELSSRPSGPDSASARRGPARATTTLRFGDAFGETELEAGGTKTKMKRDALRRPRALLCRIELQGYVRRELPMRLSARIDESLRRRSPAYAWLRERGELDPPRVLVQPAGTRAADQEARILTLRGQVWLPEVRVVGA